jgi:hypothetical protein
MDRHNLKRTHAPFDETKPVKVYWNLHRKCYSVVQNRLVVCHAQYIKLENVTFKISEAGRQRVIKEQRKNVHAYMIGTLSPKLFRITGSHALTYNPYVNNCFVIRKSLSPLPPYDLQGTEVHEATHVIAVVNHSLDGTQKSSIRAHIKAAN